MAWEYMGTSELTQDIAGKWRARALLSDGASETAHFIKFQSEPTEEQIQLEAQRICDALNAPPAEEGAE